MVEAAGRIGQYPEIGPNWRELGGDGGRRFVALARFPYIIVYEPPPRSRPVIIRVLHGAMDLPAALPDG